MNNDVLVVAADPRGWLACELALAGIGVVDLERLRDHGLQIVVEECRLPT